MKWGATAITSAFTFISPVSSSMLAPVATQIASDFNESRPFVLSMYTSIFVLAYGASSLHTFEKIKC